MPPEPRHRTTPFTPLALLFVAVALLATTAPAHAANRWYQVEVIVFRYADPSVAEQAVAPAILPDFRGARPLVTDVAGTDAAPAPRPNEVMRPGPVPYDALPRSALIMAGIYRRLRDLPAYDPVLHVGWRQPGGALGSRAVYVTDNPRVPADVAVDTGAVPLTPEPARIEGTVRVRTGRLLHVEADFLDHGQAAPVRINERRKVKFKELHYFDNPFFGLIVQVTPYHVEPLPGAAEETEPEAED
jgi:hypothetical protein